MDFKVIISGTNRKLVYDFLLVVYSITFAASNTVFEKFDVKQSNDLEICPRSLKIAIFNAPLSFDALSPANPREYLHKPYTTRNYVPWATFLSLTVYG